MLQSLGSQRVRQDFVTEQQQKHLPTVSVKIFQFLPTALFQSPYYVWRFVTAAPNWQVCKSALTLNCYITNYFKLLDPKTTIIYYLT